MINNCIYLTFRKGSTDDVHYDVTEKAKTLSFCPVVCARTVVLHNFGVGVTSCVRLPFCVTFDIAPQQNFCKTRINCASIPALGPVKERQFGSFMPYSNVRGTKVGPMMFEYSRDLHGLMRAHPQTGFNRGRLDETKGTLSIQSLHKP